jgi:hypothetical protein
MKIVVKKRNDTGTGLPYPYVDTVDSEEVDSESTLIKEVYRNHGPGRYVMTVNPGSTFRKVWDGYIRDALVA